MQGPRRYTRQPEHRVNERVWAQKVRLIGADGKQIGVVSREEMLARAKQAGVDAVEVVARANPPVVKLIEYSKFKYQEEKKERRQRKKERKATEQKEVRLSPFIGEGDFEVRTEKIREFLREGHKVRTVIVFRRRQMAHREFGYRLIERILRKLAGEAKIDQEPKFLGLRLTTVIVADKTSPSQEARGMPTRGGVSGKSK